MPSATRRTPSSTRSRVASDTLRMVPSRLAVSGITLRVVPASIFATVTTAGSKTLTWRRGWRERRRGSLTVSWRESIGRCMLWRKRSPHYGGHGETSSLVPDDHSRDRHDDRALAARVRAAGGRWTRHDRGARLAGPDLV